MSNHSNPATANVGGPGGGGKWAAAARRFRTAGAFWAVAMALCSGCGGKYDLHPATGRVLLKDGTPLNGMRIVFENQQTHIGSVAISDDEGRFELGTVQSGDGAILGAYRVAVVDTIAHQKMDRSALRIHPKYENLKTSDLKFEITEDNHELEMILDRP